MADSFQCYLGSMVVKCLQSTDMYENGKESKPLPVSVKTNVHMFSLRLNLFVSFCFLAHWQYRVGLVWMDPGSGETLTIVHVCASNVVIQFELCFGCRCFPLSCQWPKCEGMAPE